jgi:hypothetical protein
MHGTTSDSAGGTDIDLIRQQRSLRPGRAM